jgi:hypothetical protein
MSEADHPRPGHEEAEASEEARAPASASEPEVVAPKKRRTFAERRKGRFKIVLSVLTALTSLLGAIAAWQAEVGSTKRDSANGAGFSKSVANEQAQSTIRANVESELISYVRAKSYQAEATALRRQAKLAVAPDAGHLRVQATLETDLAARILAGLDPDAFGPGHVFDPGKEYEIDYALAKTNSDFDSAKEFTSAEHQATKADRLVGLTVLLIAAAFFFTLAQVSSRRSTAKLYLAGGLLVLASSTTMLLLVLVAT